jgi:SAM-dependent methyltransferase
MLLVERAWVVTECIHAMNPHADRIAGLYERHAHDYIADRGHQLRHERAWLDRFTTLLPLAASILDLGCGSGEPIARHLIEQGFAVDGVDTSPTLIGVCRDRFPGRSWQVADMRTLSLGRTYHGLLAWDSFFHLSRDDQRRMFSVFSRHAGPGTVLMFTSGGSNDESVGLYRGEPLYHASLAAEEYEALLDSNGFRVVEHVVNDPDCGGHTVWIAQAEHEP